MIKFFFSKTFVINLIIAIAITGGGLWYVFKYLDDFTLHGQTVTVPDFIGLKVSELDEIIKDKQLSYVISDSIFDAKKPKGTILDQHPKAENQVKEGRKIYLTLNAMTTPKVKLPEIKDLSIRQASARIESYGLLVGILIPQPSTCKDCALGMQMNGDEVEPGDLVEENSTVDIIVGVGESGEVIPVPNMVTKTYDEAKQWLKTLSLNAVIISIEDCETEEDSINAKIYKQSPESNKENVINLGGAIDLWLTGDSIKLNSYLPDSLKMPLDTTRVE